MKILYTIKELIKGLLLRVFPSFGPRGVIDTLIDLYNRIKIKNISASENELLNILITARVKTPPRVASVQEEFRHYAPLLYNKNKTLEDVIWAVINYEYFESRETYLRKRIPEAEISEAKKKAKRLIKERIKNKKIKDNGENYAEVTNKTDEGEIISLKSRMATFLLAFFLGVFGAHRFYVGKIRTGVAMLILIVLSPITELITHAICVVWVIIDCVIILTGNFEDKKSLRIQRW